MRRDRPSTDTERDGRKLSLVTGAADGGAPLSADAIEADGEALWDLAVKKRSLATRPGLSPELRAGLAASAGFDELRAQLRSPRPQRPRRVPDHHPGAEDR